MNRREFLKTGLAALFGALLPKKATPQTSEPEYPGLDMMIERCAWEPSPYTPCWAQREPDEYIRLSSGYSLPVFYLAEWQQHAMDLAVQAYDRIALPYETVEFEIVMNSELWAKIEPDVLEWHRLEDL